MDNTNSGEKDTERKDWPANAVAKVTVETGQTCFVKEPGRGTMEIVMGMIAPVAGEQPKYLQAAEIMLNECWITGDEEIKDEERLRIEAGMACMSLMSFKAAKLEKR